MTKRKTHIVLWLLFAGVPLVVAGVVVAFFLLRSGSGPKDTGPNLFIMQRSTNANEVHYDVQAGADGALADEPVVAYWVMKADGGGREDLTFFEEEMAYGFEVLEPDSNGDRELNLVAFDKRKIVLSRDENGQWRARTQIDGEDAYLTRLFIEVDDGGITPTVLSVDAFGETVDGGDPVEEHMPNE
jgi:hypothetical protein